MKYLKIFEDFNNRQYKEITNEYGDSESIKFGEDEANKICENILNIIKKESKIKNQSARVSVDLSMIYVDFNEIGKNNVLINIDINKLEDEYFDVHIYIPHSAYEILSIKYRCDEVDGLYNLMRDLYKIIPYAMTYTDDQFIN